MMEPPPPEGQSSWGKNVVRWSLYLRCIPNDGMNLNLWDKWKKDVARTCFGSVFVFKIFFHLVGYASALVEAGGAIKSYTIHL